MNNQTKIRIAFIFGTRPEAIKLAPLILQAREDAGFEAIVCVTGQHRQMLDPVLEFFQIVPDVDLKLMTHNQGLAYMTARILESVTDFLDAHKPDYIMVQGDTTTVMASSLAAFYQRIPICHVEAGLRTGNKFSPFPEEINRQITSAVGDLHFAPTQRAADALLKEGISADTILVSGNTVIDALLLTLEKLRDKNQSISGLEDSFFDARRRMILITCHRRESFGESLNAICEAIAELANAYPEVDFVYPVHLNPNVREPVYRLLAGHPNIRLLEPQDYPAFVQLMQRATFILSDSGGIQEEAPTLKKPVLIMRDTTERPEGIEAGVVRLIGTSKENIIAHCTELLEQESVYHAMQTSDNPYGDGISSRRILDFILKYNHANSSY